MVLHFVVLAKVKLICSSSHGSSRPIAVTLVWPFVLKLAFRFRFLRGAYIDMVHSTRLFFFQLGQIAFDSETVLERHSGNRFERALRLVCQRLTHVNMAHATETAEDNLRSLSILLL